MPKRGQGQQQGRVWLAEAAPACGAAGELLGQSRAAVRSLCSRQSGTPGHWLQLGRPQLPHPHLQARPTAPVTTKALRHWLSSNRSPSVLHLEAGHDQLLPLEDTHTDELQHADAVR